VLREVGVVVVISEVEAAGEAVPPSVAWVGGTM
jgi:hypothetical protein